MRKERTLLILGIFVALLPYMGFYDSWRRILFMISGLSIIYIAYLFYIEAKARLDKNDDKIKSFIDNIKSGE